MASEEVQLSVSQVKNKKRDGQLFLMETRIAWCPNGKDQFDISVMYADVKCQKVSPGGKSKVQLQIILLNEESYVFHFTNAASAISDRDGVKNLLAKMLPLHRRKIDKELKEKNRLLQEDPELFLIYKDLVGTAVITAEEFWASHSAKLSKISNESNTQQDQRVGVSTGFLADVKRADGCNNFRYNLSSDTIQSILRTFPAVKKKYLEKVPGKMTGQDFWTLFFQSHYFHRDRVNHANNREDLFADCVQMDEKEIDAILTQGVSDIFNDMKYLDDEDSTKADGYGTSVEPANVKPSNNALIQKNIIKRFNYQSAMILKHSKDGSSTSSKSDEHSNGNSASEEGSPSKRLKLQEAIRYGDLESEHQNDRSDFSLHKSERYRHGPTAQSQTRQVFSSYQAKESLRSMLIQCSNYQPKLSSTLSSSNAAWALNDVTTNSAAAGMQAVNDPTEDALTRVLNATQHEELKHLYLSSSELLRHFWMCFPATTPAMQDKVQRLFDSIRTFHQNRVLPFKEQLQRHRVGTNVTEHLEEMLAKASEKYSLWQKRMSMRR